MFLAKCATKLITDCGTGSLVRQQELMSFPVTEVGALEIASRTTADGRSTSCIRSIGEIIFFNCLKIDTKWSLAMFLVLGGDKG